MSVGIAAHTATRLNTAVIDEAIAVLRALTEHRDDPGPCPNPTNHGSYAKPPAHMLRDDAPDTAEDEPSTEPSTAKRTRRPRKPTT